MFLCEGTLKIKENIEGSLLLCGGLPRHSFRLTVGNRKV